MWIILTFAAIAAAMILCFCAAADLIERRWERWEEWQHPPDRVERFDDPEEDDRR